MKTNTIKLSVILFFGVALFLAGCNATVTHKEGAWVSYDSIELKPDSNGDTLAYFNDKPFTGRTSRDYDNHQKEFEAEYKDGKLNGLLISWDRNGNKKSEKVYVNDNPDGPYTFYDDKGLKSEEGVQKYISKNNTWVYEGLIIKYDEGKKISEETYRNDTLNGPYTFYYDNGQKKEEGIYNNGEVVLEKAKFWDENGQPSEN